MAVDQAKLDEFVGKAVGDLGAALTAALVVIGDKLGPLQGDGRRRRRSRRPSWRTRTGRPSATCASG